MVTGQLARFGSAAVCVVASATAVSAATVASDNADQAAYNSVGSDSYVGDNGGTGFAAFNVLQNPSSNGGAFLSTSRAVDGSRSFGVFAASGAVGRSLTAPVSVGSYAVTGRFDLDNNGFAGFNIKSAAGTQFGSDAFELLSFGLTPDTGTETIFVSGGDNITFAGNDLRGDILDFVLDFDTNADTYTLTVTDRDGTAPGVSAGSLQNGSSGAVSVLGFGNFTTGSEKNLIFDSLSVSAVPEPVSVLGGTALLGVVALRRRTQSLA